MSCGTVGPVDDLARGRSSTWWPVTASAVVIVSAVVLVAAAAIAWWHGLITLVLGGVWFVHELRLHRQRRGR